MGELVIIQTSSLVKCFLALVTFEKVLSTAVGRHVVHKGSAVCLWTQVTSISISTVRVHLLTNNQLEILEGEIELCLLLNDNFHNAIICKPEMILRVIDLHNLLIRFYWTRIVDSWLLKDQNC